MEKSFIKFLSDKKTEDGSIWADFLKYIELER